MSWDEALNFCKTKAAEYGGIKGRLAFINSEEVKNSVFGIKKGKGPGKAWVGLKTKHGVRSSIVRLDCSNSIVFEQWEWTDGNLSIPLNITLWPCDLAKMRSPNCLVLQYYPIYEYFSDRDCYDKTAIPNTQIPVNEALCEFYV